MRLKEVSKGELVCIGKIYLYDLGFLEQGNENCGPYMTMAMLMKMVTVVVKARHYT